MRHQKSGVVAIFVGALLIVVFAVGLIASRNPGAFTRKNYYDFALEQAVDFCRNWWLPAGIIGFPTFLVSLILSLRKESRENRENR